MSDEAIANCGDDEVGLMTSTVALSGAVAVIAHIDGPMLHIASCGDCVAVLGNDNQLLILFENLSVVRFVLQYYFLHTVSYSKPFKGGIHTFCTLFCNEYS